MVHQSQNFAYARPLELGCDYAIEVEAHRDPASDGRVTMRATIRDGSGDIVLASETLLLIVDAPALGAPRRRPLAAAASAIPELHMGPIGLRQTRRYAAASLDDNPLHRDPAAARAAGLDGPIVHGMLLAGQFERALAAWRRDLRIGRLYATFLQPLPIGGRIVIGSRIAQSTRSGDGERLVVRLAVRNDADDIVCVGEVEAFAPRREPSASGY